MHFYYLLKTGKVWVTLDQLYDQSYTHYRNGTGTVFKPIMNTWTSVSPEEMAALPLLPDVLVQGKLFDAY